MPAIQELRRDRARDTTTVTTVRLARTVDAPSSARRYVRRELAAPMSAQRLSDIALMTSEVVTNAVEHSRAGQIEVAVVGAVTFTRIEVSNPGQSWARRPQPRSPVPEEVGGWGLFLVEQLSDRWGVSDDDATVWFEFDHKALFDSAGGMFEEFDPASLP
jgi:anti-sigma regulatory factor (Ser/Thr protein kinase)